MLSPPFTPRQKHAVRIAHELRRDAYQGCVIHVLDAAEGTDVARVPIGGGDLN